MVNVTVRYGTQRLYLKVRVNSECIKRLGSNRRDIHGNDNVIYDVDTYYNMSKTTIAQTKSEMVKKLAEMEAEDNQIFIEAVFSRFLSPQTQIVKSGSGRDQIAISLSPNSNIQTNTVKVFGSLYVQSLTQNKADLEALIKAQ